MGLVSCEKSDDTELVKMRINHYQQPANNYEFFYGLSFIVQEGSEIGNTKWYGFSGRISGFDYELGYTYDIIVQKKRIKNPMIDMPDTEYSLFKILSKTKVPDDTTFDIELAIKFPNGYEPLVTLNEESEFTLLGKTVIDCGELCGELENYLENETGMVGTFRHIDAETIQLLKLTPKTL